MALDGIVISKLTRELRSKLNGKKINKIFQYNNDNIIFSFKEYNLLISCNATYPRLYLSDSSYVQDDKQSNFLQNLRKHLQGAIVTDINQVGLDRIVKISFIALNDFKERINLHLILEIMGKYSNIILVNDEDIIIDSFVHVTSFISSKRTILPKGKYERVLEDNKYDIKEIMTKSDDDKKEVIKKIISNKESIDNSSSKNNYALSFLTSTFYGISKPVCENFLIDYTKSKKDNNSSDDINDIEIDEKLITNFINYIANIVKDDDDENDENKSNNKNANDNLKIYFDKDIPCDFHVIELSNIKHDNEIKYESMSKLIETFYEKKARANSIKSQSSDIKLLLTNQMSKVLKKKEIHTKNIEQSKEADIYKIYGDLIFSNIYNIKKGDSSARVINYYDDNNELTIKLDENLTPQENANRYYKKFNKAKSTLKNSISLLKDTDEEIVYLETVMSYLDNALNKDDIENIREELRSEGYLKKKTLLSKLKKKKDNEKSSAMKFISSDGFEIYVGRNNIQNDEITFKIGKDSDVWLHVQDIPGSHVIIKTKGNGLSSVPESTLLEAANLGVFYSKGRESTKVPIDYTERRYVRKPSGSKPGFVIFLNNKTLYITPNKDILSKFNIKEL